MRVAEAAVLDVVRLEAAVVVVAVRRPSKAADMTASDPDRPGLGPGLPEAVALLPRLEEICSHRLELVLFLFIQIIRSSSTTKSVLPTLPTTFQSHQDLQFLPSSSPVFTFFNNQPQIQWLLPLQRVT